MLLVYLSFYVNSKKCLTNKNPKMNYSSNEKGYLQN
uniref:Uncharacterized protein n=1 Tax=Arundo donax TaxID=35708 RepID=A0A0A8ZK68_ARUDO